MYTYHSRSRRILDFLSRARPDAVAQLCGSVEFSGVRGTLMLYQANVGVFTVVSIGRIPKTEDGFSFISATVRESESGGGRGKEKIYCVAPPVSADGPEVWTAFLNGGFRVCDVVGKKAVFELSGAGGKKKILACGEIRGVRGTC